MKEGKTKAYFWYVCDTLHVLTSQDVRYSWIVLIIIYLFI